MRIVTRPDFDGVVCAALILDSQPVDAPTLWAEPGDLQKGLVPVAPGDILANLPYHPACDIWFDHHITNRIDTPFEGLFRVAPSAARLVYEYYQDRLSRDYAELVRQTDKVDDADLTRDEVLHPENYPCVILSMTISGQHAGDEPYWNRLADLLRKQDIPEIMTDPEVTGRCEKMVEKNRIFRQILESGTRMEDHVSVSDYRSYDQTPEGNRFLVYSLFPDAVVSVRVRRHHTLPDKVIIGAGHSIFNRNCHVSLGRMFSKFGGGGHRGAASCTVPADRADEVLSEVLAILKENRSNEPGAAPDIAAHKRPH